MYSKLFSNRDRPFHFGPYPLERLARCDEADLTHTPAMRALDFSRPEQVTSIVNAMGEYQAAMDATTHGKVNKVKSTIPADLQERANHLKAFGYFGDASMVGICELPKTAFLDTPLRNPDIDRLAEDLKTRQTTSIASGIDMIMAGLKDAMNAPPAQFSHHTHAIIILFEHLRDPSPEEPGSDWILDAQDHRACLRSSEAAVIMGNYIRTLGYDALAHTATTSGVDLNKLAVAAGLASVKDGALEAPWLGARFGLAAVTTNLPLLTDKPLAKSQPWMATSGPSWWMGKGSVKGGLTRDPYAKRDYVDGPHPFETLKRVDSPTTYIDEANIPRVPKRTDMFARAKFGELGKAVQENATGGYFSNKAATAGAQRRLMGAFVLFQDGPSADGPRPTDAERNAANIKAASYFLGADAAGLSRCPEWVWYSHDATGAKIDPPHDQAISMIIDQGFETMDGASGDDWISVSLSMRAYLRFSLLGGIIAKHIRNLGFKAAAHTNMEGKVIQPPLLLLSGLGEVSRIGEVILNPFLGPRLKSGVVTTDMPMAHDKPIDFGLQKFCEQCNKCARECPAGAITAGPKLMFNGYETWKSDSQKCSTYRITTPGGAMCGRCMKTCPWNLEGLFAEKPFRWAAMNIPKAAPALAKLDDFVGNGGLNDQKKWWWDLKLGDDGAYHPVQEPVNRRGLQKDLKLKFEDQTLAVYPANLAPHPHLYPFPMDREAGIEAYQALVTAEEYKAKISKGERDHLHIYTNDGPSPVLRVKVSKVEAMTKDVTKYELRALDGADLPEWAAGAHLDIVVAPEYLRQYSMSGDPADRSKYQIGVLREDEGKGGSKLLHRIFSEGRKIFISEPINHFPLNEQATKTFLMGGGIGITPMIAFAHRMHHLGLDFELHYSASSRDNAGFLQDLADMPWAERVTLHISDENKRADLDSILSDYADGWHVYTCGPDRYMNGVIEAAERQGFPEEARHLEYFSVPEQPDYENHDFILKLVKSGKELHVPADKSATDVLTENGIPIDVKCDDGLCGVCKCGLLAGEVEHRDFVLSGKQRETQVILCQSRAAQENGVIEVDL